MKIGVCAKVVPDTAAQIKTKADGSGIETAGLKWVVNPYDSNAIEAAVQLVDAKKAASAHGYAVGDDSAVNTLRPGGLAVGLTDLTLINDPALSDSDHLGAAKALAAAIKADGIGLVLCGKVSVDDDAVQVPAMLAELLGWPLVSMVNKLDVDGDAFSATRAVGGGVEEEVSGSLPAVITCDKGLNTPRYAKLPDIVKSKRKPVNTKSLSDLGLSAADVAAKVEVSAYGGPPARPAGRILEGDLPAQVNELVRLLRDEAKVI